MSIPNPLAHIKFKFPPFLGNNMMNTVIQK